MGWFSQKVVLQTFLEKKTQVRVSYYKVIFGWFLPKSCKVQLRKKEYICKDYGNIQRMVSLKNLSFQVLIRQRWAEQGKNANDGNQSNCKIMIYVDWNWRGQNTYHSVNYLTVWNKENFNVISAF